MVNNIFKVGGGGGVFWSSVETMGEEVISTQDLNIREAINRGDIFCWAIALQMSIKTDISESEL